MQCTFCQRIVSTYRTQRRQTHMQWAAIHHLRFSVQMYVKNNCAKACADAQELASLCRASPLEHAYALN